MTTNKTDKLDQEDLDSLDEDDLDGYIADHPACCKKCGSFVCDCPVIDNSNNMDSRDSRSIQRAIVSFHDSKK